MNNRIIKFRAWDNHNKVMKIYSLKELAGEDKFGYDTEFEAIQSGFDNWIWMQFTGLKDKNGKEICEGDIVEWKPVVLDRKMRGKVIWHMESGAWFVKDDIGDCNHLGLLLYISTEVIGNIYENPELLK